MSYISDKIAEIRALGHSIPHGIEELFLAIEEKIGLEAPKPLPETSPNPLEGVRVDS